MPSATMPAASLARLKFTMSDKRPPRSRTRHICGLRLIPDNVQNSTTTTLNVKRPTAILMPAPREVAPIVGIAFWSAGHVSDAIG